MPGSVWRKKETLRRQAVETINGSSASSAVAADDSRHPEQYNVGIAPFVAPISQSIHKCILVRLSGTYDSISLRGAIISATESDSLYRLTLSHISLRGVHLSGGDFQSFLRYDSQRWDSCL
ncbi:hypothetical protein CEXT_185981 [Caerostris extrusa]|uniref:Uncharacterized protein n=1 Tax=Caerostris extrusa TaxID=172846 RepID=A0AAV4MGD2_CAEEX|nr:hypothetical protein CEXT_185981 [Caerostris extrusa]